MQLFVFYGWPCCIAKIWRPLDWPQLVSGLSAACGVLSMDPLKNNDPVFRCPGWMNDERTFGCCQIYYKTTNFLQNVEMNIFSSFCESRDLRNPLLIDSLTLVSYNIIKWQIYNIFTVGNIAIKAKLYRELSTQLGSKGMRIGMYDLRCLNSPYEGNGLFLKFS